jgi:hypothetical protein
MPHDPATPCSRSGSSLGNQIGVNVKLDARSTQEINTTLQDCDLLSCQVDKNLRLAVVTLGVFSILPPDGDISEEYPLHVAAYPIGRVAASHVIEGKLQPVELDSIDEILAQYANKEIDDWDILDPPEQFRFQWSDRLSFDRRWDGATEHVLELWQGWNPSNIFNISIWFENIHLFDRHLNSVTLEMLTTWRQNLKEAMDATTAPGQGWRRFVPGTPPPADLTQVAERITAG